MNSTRLPTRRTPLLLGLLFLMPLATIRAQNASLLPASAYPGLRGADGSLLPSVAPYLGRDIKPLTLTVGADLLKKRANFGYTDDEIRKLFSTPVALTLDETGLNTSLVKPVPAAGIHPRAKPPFRPSATTSRKSSPDPKPSSRPTTIRWRPARWWSLSTRTSPSR